MLWTVPIVLFFVWFIAHPIVFRCCSLTLTPLGCLISKTRMFRSVWTAFISIGQSMAAWIWEDVPYLENAIRYRGK